MTDTQPARTAPRRSRARGIPVAGLAAVALIGAGCGSTAPSQTATANPSGAASSTREKALKFAHCMRNDGVSEFPDPDASGELTIDAIANGSSLDPNTAAFKRALVACKDLEPAGFTGRKRGTQQQKTALRFAECIRENGVTDFPDPASGEPLVDTRRIPSANAPGGMATLNAAMAKCRSVVADLLADQ
jgi:hypothetical protein